MPMTEAEAFNIIELVGNVYDMKFNDEKYKIWLDFLTKNGDYQQTLLKTKQYIKEKKFKPTVSEILGYKPNTKIVDTIPVEETKAYKLQHDPEFKKRHEERKKKWQQMKQEWGVMDDET